LLDALLGLFLVLGLYAIGTSLLIAAFGVVIVIIASVVSFIKWTIERFRNGKEEQ